MPPCQQLETPGYCGVVKTDAINVGTEEAPLLIPVGPLLLQPEAQLAITVYHRAVALSGFDVFGLPQITNLGLALELMQLELEGDQIQDLTQYVLHISDRVRAHRAAQKPPPEE
jgi:hypothetical protein